MDGNHPKLCFLEDFLDKEANYKKNEIDMLAANQELIKVV